MKNFFREDSNYSILLVTFAPEIINNGALAHLARAFDWQSRGDEFESRMLHKKRSLKAAYFCGAHETCTFFYFANAKALTP